MERHEEIFISWSGRASRLVAEELRQWLPLVVNGIAIWMSSLDLRHGKRWTKELANRLEKCNFGVLAMTPQNMDAPWLVFEAGALSKNLQAGHVIPYIMGAPVGDLDGPLAQFQAVSANRDGTLQIVKAINDVTTFPAAETVLMSRFDIFWPKLEAKLTDLNSIVSDEYVELESPKKNQVIDDPMINSLRIELSETKEMVRQLVTVWGPAGSKDNKRQAEGKSNETSIHYLEGAWFDPHLGTQAYARVINGQLHMPYCYHGGSELTGAFYDWRKVGLYWYCQFRWHGGAAISMKGFTMFRLRSRTELDGEWWSNESPSPGLIKFDEMPLEMLKDGFPLKFERAEIRKTPRWAQKYFTEVETGDAETILSSWRM